MRREPAEPPVIILGMHRSGTTLLVRLLKMLGFFAGARVVENQEAPFFLDLNEWLMRRAGGAWDHPLPVKLLDKVDELRIEAVNILRQSVHSAHFAQFTGSLIRTALNRGGNIKSSWGWKDPRTIFTLGLWLEVFPNARILYLTRNGVDVAHSLFTRAMGQVPNRNNGLLSRMPLNWRIRNAFRPVERHILQSVRCCSLRECYTLWEEYVAEAEQAFDGFKNGKMAVRYEDLLGTPEASLRDIAAFCGLEAGRKDIARAAAIVDCGRSFAFVRDEALFQFYLTVKDSAFMRKLGYGDIARNQSGGGLSAEDTIAAV